MQITHSGFNKKCLFDSVKFVSSVEKVLSFSCLADSKLFSPNAIPLWQDSKFALRRQLLVAVHYILSLVDLYKCIIGYWGHYITSLVDLYKCIVGYWVQCVLEVLDHCIKFTQGICDTVSFQERFSRHDRSWMHTLIKTRER